MKSSTQCRSRLWCANFLSTTTRSRDWQVIRWLWKSSRLALQLSQQLLPDPSWVWTSMELFKSPIPSHSQPQMSHPNIPMTTWPPRISPQQLHGQRQTSYTRMRWSSNWRRSTWMRTTLDFILVRIWVISSTPAWLRISITTRKSSMSGLWLWFMTLAEVLRVHSVCERSDCLQASWRRIKRASSIPRSETLPQEYWIFTNI